MSARNLDCGEVVNSLPLHSGGDLHPARRAALDRHLATCAACRSQAADARRAREALLQGLERDRVGGLDLWPALRSALVSEGVLRAGPDPRLADAPRSGSDVRPIRRVDPRWRWLPIGTLAAAALLAGLWLQRSTSPAPDAGTGTELAPPAPLLVDQALPDPDSSALVVTPVKAPAGLRRLAPGDARWSDTADVFGIEQSPMQRFSPWSPNAGSPVSLQRVRPNMR